MKLDFISVMDLYITPTAQLADIVLPAASWLEVDEVAAVPFRAGNVVLAQQKARLTDGIHPQVINVELGW